MTYLWAHFAVTSPRGQTFDWAGPLFSGGVMITPLFTCVVGGDGYSPRSLRGQPDRVRCARSFSGWLGSFWPCSKKKTGVRLLFLLRILPCTPPLLYLPPRAPLHCHLHPSSQLLFTGHFAPWHRRGRLRLTRQRHHAPWM